MKLITFMFFSLSALGANAPSDVGNYTGLLFSGAAISQPLTIQGGSLENCKFDPGSTTDIYKDCKLSGVRIEVGLRGEATNLTYDFTGASVITSKNPRYLHYYLRGTRTLDFGKQVVTQPILAVLNIDPKTPKRVTGYLEISTSGIRSGFEAYQD